MTTPITALELRSIEIPPHPLVEILERETGRSLTHEHRHYLAGEAVHCGEILELFFDGQWIVGRYEWTGDVSDLPTFEHADGFLELTEGHLLRWRRHE